METSNHPTDSTAVAQAAIPLRVFIVGWAVLATISTVGSIFAPYLSVNYPLLLVALSPLSRHLLLVAPVVDPVALVVTAMVRRGIVSATLFYGMGLWHADRARESIHDQFPSFGETIDLIETWFRKLDWIFVAGGGVIPWMLGGATAMNIRKFYFLSIAGAAAQAALAIYFGSILEEPIRWVLDLFREHMTAATLVLAIVVAAFQLPRFFSWLKNRKHHA